MPPLRHAHPFLRNIKSSSGNNNKNNNNNKRPPSRNQSLFDDDDDEKFPILASVSDIIAQSSYFAVRPLINSQSQMKLAKKALKLKSRSNVRIANASYNSLFFDPLAHVPLTASIVEGDAQALLFTFQRSRNLFQKIHQTVGIVFQNAEMMDDDDNDKKKKKKKKENNKKGEDSSSKDPKLISDPENTISLLQVFQQCVFELFQIITHARTTVCRMPLLFAGSSDVAHMILEINDWAIQIRETLFNAIEFKLSSSSSSKNNDSPSKNNNGGDDDELDFELFEASHQSKCLLWSDASWTPPALKKEIEKAEKWITNQELPYIISSLKEMIKKWTGASSPSRRFDQFSLLNCYGVVMDDHQQHDNTTTSNKKKDDDHHHQNESNNNNHDDDVDDANEEILHDLQLSLQRVQLFSGEKQNVSDWNQSSAQHMDTTNNNNTSAASSYSHQKSSLLDISATTTTQQTQVKTTPFFASVLPEHVLESRKFLEQLTLTQKMQVAVTVNTLELFMQKWKKFLKTKKAKFAKIDGIMRRNAALHCLARFRVWKERQEAARVARRATYGTKGQRFHLSEDYRDEGEDGNVVVGTITKSTQTFAPGTTSATGYSAPRFLLKIVE